jgi:hypothetical protein
LSFGRYPNLYPEWPYLPIGKTSLPFEIVDCNLSNDSSRVTVTVKDSSDTVSAVVLVRRTIRSLPLNVWDPVVIMPLGAAGDVFSIAEPQYPRVSVWQAEQPALALEAFTVPSPRPAPDEAVAAAQQAVRARQASSELPPAPICRGGSDTLGDSDVRVLGERTRLVSR